jgi:hypothetical protein
MVKSLIASGKSESKSDLHSKDGSSGLGGAPSTPSRALTPTGHPHISESTSRVAPHPSAHSSCSEG